MYPFPLLLPAQYLILSLTLTHKSSPYSYTTPLEVNGITHKSKVYGPDPAHVLKFTDVFKFTHVHGPLKATGQHYITVYSLSIQPCTVILIRSQKLSRVGPGQLKCKTKYLTIEELLELSTWVWMLNPLAMQNPPQLLQLQEEFKWAKCNFLWEM